MAQSYQQPPSFAPRDVFSRVELSISCSNLKDMDVFSKSDPCVFLYLKTGGSWFKLGRTEVIDNNLNPKFSKTLLIEYRFEEIQHLRFVVYDIDDRNHIEDAKRHDLIGEIQCSLADVVTAGQYYERTLRLSALGTSRGKIRIQAEEVQDSKFTIQMKLSASKLDKKDLFGKSDPFFEISKAQEGGTFTIVYRSQHQLKTLDPRWSAFELPVQKLCTGDWDRVLKLSVWDWNRSGDHDYIGECTTTLRDICPERGGQVFNLPLINAEKKRKKKKYINSGTLNFVSVKAIPLHSFVDYIRGGCQVSLMVAVDFTASNGNPQQSNSLHYNHPSQDNEYVQAIKSVASVLAPYDSDQLIPVYGFGARLPPNGEVSHCFPLNFNYERPEVQGVQGILQAYYQTLRSVQLYGPTNFSLFLDRAIQLATGGCSQQNQNYCILLVITDGVISDMARTTDRIVAASNLPLSIVIVGVGSADFANMEILDADDTPLVSQYGKRMTRDIVQFVPFRQFKSKSGADFSLAQETLAEIPGQFTSFMKANRIIPNPPPLRRQQNSVILQGPSLDPATSLSNQASAPPYQMQGQPVFNQAQPPFNQAQPAFNPAQPPFNQAPPPYPAGQQAGAPYPLY